MASRGIQDFNNLSKGFTTEANPVDFPEGYTVDENNCIIANDGSRQRRLGLEPISDGTYLANKTVPTRFYVWESPGDSSSDRFIVQISKVSVTEISFYKSIEDFYSGLGPFRSFTLTFPYGITEDSEVTFSTVNGYLLVGIEGMSPEAFYYRQSAPNNVQRIKLDIFVRDFWGIQNIDRSFASPTYKYDMANRGWTIREDIVPRITQSFLLDSTVFDIETTEGNLPSMTLNKFRTEMGRDPNEYDIYSLGLKANDEGDLELNKNQYESNNIGSTESPKGKFIFKLNDFNRRLYIREDLNAPPSSSLRNPTVVGSFAGRAWYGVSDASYDSVSGFSTSGTVFFSQIVQKPVDLVKCYQEADPTSEEISEAIASDGGFINISGASTIVSLQSVFESLLVFATNGVWEIKGGGNAGFSATDYEVNKISSYGAVSSTAVSVAGSGVVYLSFSGIHTIVPNESGYLVEQDMSSTAIRRFYNRIPNACKQKATLFYNEIDNEFRVAYSDDFLRPHEKRKELVYNVKEQAFTKNSYFENANHYLLEYIPNPRQGRETFTAETLDTSGDFISTTTPNSQVLTLTTNNYERSLSFLTVVVDNNWQDDEIRLDFCEFSNKNFVDLGEYDFYSYLVSGPVTFGDTMRNKQIVYLNTHFEKTETGFINESGFPQLDNESSCWVSIQWDYNNKGGIKSTKPFQSYRFRKFYAPTLGGDDFDTGETLVTTKNKVRGYGKALSVRFESEEGKDFKLLGWGLSIEGRGAV